MFDFYKAYVRINLKLIQICSHKIINFLYLRSGGTRAYTAATPMYWT